MYEMEDRYFKLGDHPFIIPSPYVIIQLHEHGNQHAGYVAWVTILQLCGGADHLCCRVDTFFKLEISRIGW